VIKLAGEAIAAKSKDLQLAAWMTEALLKTESFAGLRAGLGLIRSLVENFWDNLYPEIEDGDLEVRAAPLDWLGSRQDSPLRNLPITRKGVSWYQFKEARGVGYETETDPARLEARTNAIAEGKMSGEDWDQAFNATPKSYYVELEATLDGVLEEIESLTSLFGERFGDDAPSFAPMRTTIEEIRHTVHGLLQKKRAAEPDEAPAEEREDQQPAEEEASGDSSYPEPEPAPAAPRKTEPKRAPAAEPSDKGDAFQRIVSVAAYLRREDAHSATPYLLLRGLRFGELRSAGADLDPNMLEAPSTETRQSLKKAANDCDWAQVIDIAESAMGMPCGRGWLDLQRYACRAAYELGYSQIQSAIRAEVNALLTDYPALRQAALLDDTPAANPETQAWLDEIAPTAVSAVEPAHIPHAVVVEETRSGEQAGPPDANDRAMEAARAGRHQEAIEILTREAAMERSGRSRFQRRLQLAQLCVSVGLHQIAQPILEQITSEVDARALEGWETPALVAQPFTLLYQCLEKSKADPEVKKKIYDRICRLDPLQALACGR
jgi:type VI secretion system protein ImpA